ncbi:MAG: hypothetical protein WKF60_12540 [Ilumatobacter sp.]
MTARCAGDPVAGDAELIEAYAVLGAAPTAVQNRRAIARRFTGQHGSIEAWTQRPVAYRLAESVVLRTYAAWAVVQQGLAVDVDYVVGTPTKWANHVRNREPVVHAEFLAVATDLGFNPPEMRGMWVTLAKLSMISGISAGVIADDAYTEPVTCTSPLSSGVAGTSRRSSAPPGSVSTR